MDDERRHLMESLIGLLKMEEVIRRASGNDALFGQLLRTGIDEYGAQETVLAEALGVSVETIFIWKAGKRLPPAQDRSQVLHALSDLVATILEEG